MRLKMIEATDFPNSAANSLNQRSLKTNLKTNFEVSPHWRPAPLYCTLIWPTITIKQRLHPGMVQQYPSEIRMMDSWNGFPYFCCSWIYVYRDREREREREGEREREIHIYLYIVYDLSNSYLVTCRFPLCKQVALLQLAAASRSFGPAWPGRSHLGADLGWNLGKGWCLLRKTTHKCSWHML